MIEIEKKNSEKYLNLKKNFLFSFLGSILRFASLHFCKQYTPNKINIYWIITKFRDGHEGTLNWRRDSSY